MQIRKYNTADLEQMIAIWNEIVEEGIAFPQEETLTPQTGEQFFASQSYCGIAADDNSEVVGLYILHPNNVGRTAYRRKARNGLHTAGKRNRLQDIAVQRRCGDQYPRKTSLREDRLQTIRCDTRRVQNEGRTLREYLPVLYRIMNRNRKAVLWNLK